MRVDHHAVQLQRADRALHFLHGAPRILHRNRREARVARRMAPNDFREPIVADFGDLRGLARLELLHAGRRHGEDGHVDLRLIHDPQALAVEIGEPLGDLALRLHAAEPRVGIVVLRAGHEAANCRLLPGCREGFFRCDTPAGFRRHGQPPSLARLFARQVERNWRARRVRGE